MGSNNLYGKLAEAVSVPIDNPISRVDFDSRLELLASKGLLEEALLKTATCKESDKSEN